MPFAQVIKDTVENKYYKFASALPGYEWVATNEEGSIISNEVDFNAIVGYLETTYEAPGRFIGENPRPR